MRPPHLYIGHILRWADQFHRERDRWPNRNDGAVEGTLDLTWRKIDSALKVGNCGLRRGSSLAKLLLTRRKRRHKGMPPTLTEEQVLGWADADHTRTGEWPIHSSGTLPTVRGETWSVVDHSLRIGRRILPGGSSSVELLEARRGVRNVQAVPALNAEQIDPQSRVTSSLYDLAGRAVASINPLNQRTTTSYDAAGQTRASVDPLSRVTSTLYDLAGRSTVSINPLNQRTTTSYDAAGQTRASVDPLSRVTSTLYDLAGRSTVSINPLNQRTTTSYDAAGQTRASVDPLSRVTSTLYDLAGRSIASINPLNLRTTTSYDAAGQTRASVDPLSRRTSTLYDLAGRTVASINPLGFRTTTNFDTAGQAIVRIDALLRRTSTLTIWRAEPLPRSTHSTNGPRLLTMPQGKRGPQSTL